MRMRIEVDVAVAGPRLHMIPVNTPGCGVRAPGAAQFGDFNCETMFNPGDLPPADINQVPRHGSRLRSSRYKVFGREWDGVPLEPAVNESSALGDIHTLPVSSNFAPIEVGP